MSMAWDHSQLTSLLCRLRITDELEPALARLCARRASFERELAKLSQLRAEIGSLSAGDNQTPETIAWRTRGMPPAVAAEVEELEAHERVVEVGEGRYARVDLGGERPAETAAPPPRFMIRIAGDLLLECDDGAEALRVAGERERWLAFYLNDTCEQARAAAAEARHLLSIIDVQPPGPGGADEPPPQSASAPTIPSAAALTAL